MKDTNRRHHVTSIWVIFYLLLQTTTLLLTNVSALFLSSNDHHNNLAKQLQQQMILAPLTRGGNLPFRRLCADFGTNVSLSEMVYARFLCQGDRIEQARLRRSANEQVFGVQIATNDVQEGAAAIRLAVAANADFVDLNCGCPIHEATRRGLGSALLRSPTNLAQLVEGMIDATNNEIPISVKVRLGRDANSINVGEVVQQLRQVGAAAVTIHGRTAIQGYSKPSDWNLISNVVQENHRYYSEDGLSQQQQQQQQKRQLSRMAIVGNGDIFTHYEAKRRFDESQVDAVMVGRGALIKPWIFQEYATQQSWEPTLEDRVSIYRRLTCYCQDHFGNDVMGRKKAWNFLPWHFDFFARYLALPEDQYGEYTAGPLIQMRKPSLDDSSSSSIPPLEHLLSHRSNTAHDRIASILWGADSDQDAVMTLTAFAESHDFIKIQQQQQQQHPDDSDVTTTELANIRNEKDGKWHKRRGRNPKPQRTPEEIATIRAERAAKKARIAAVEEEEEEAQKLHGND